MKVRLEGGIGTSITIENGERIVLGMVEVHRVEHHVSPDHPKPTGWVMTSDGADVAIGPEHYMSGGVDAVLEVDHAEEFALAILQAVKVVREAQSKNAVGVPKPGIVLPGGVKLPGFRERGEG